MAMTLVSTVTVGSGGAANIEWTNIPQTGRDLLIYYSIRTNRTNNVGSDIDVRFNGQASNNITTRRLLGLGNSVIADTNGFFGTTSTDAATSGVFGVAQVTILNYTGSTTKSFSIDAVSENNGTTAYQSLVAGLWSGTAAITSIRILPFDTNLINQHSSASLYIIS